MVNVAGARVVVVGVTKSQFAPELTLGVMNVAPATEVLATTCCCVVPLGYVKFNDDGSDSCPVPVVFTLTVKVLKLPLFPTNEIVPVHMLFESRAGLNEI